MTALSGIRVLDASTVVMGPYATRLLADLGADVLKLEPPEGDIMRRAGQGGAIFAHLNRSKRGLVLDLKSAEGQQRLHQLAAEADVLVHNMRPEAAARLGLRKADLDPVNPGLIVASAYGYGPGGPCSGRPAYDDLIQAASGLAATVGRASGGAPAYVPMTLVDRVVGAHLAFAIVAAVACRARTGMAQEVEVPMFETFTDLVASDHLGGLSFDPPEGGPYYPRLMSPHRRPYRTRDGWIAVLLYTEAHWRRFFALLGREQELADDPRLRDHVARQANIDHAYGLVAEALSHRDTGEWMRSLSEADIPVSAVNDVEALLEDPHLRATGFWRQVPLPDGSRLRTTAPFGRWSATPPDPPGPPPAFRTATAEAQGVDAARRAAWKAKPAAPGKGDQT
ncbi:Glutarate--coa ligase (plasmid) [Roseomonas mucosa]|uniref:Glutarate--coa ligase n=1 Tax=Roseomonas mucosa TaxID=207340 RepID=A0A4Y1MT04_9PROT|nr:CoA transferase [Roseomonas mucosa]AWV20713.1 Glutarate--coa ligase [Roseomonas mucosa]MDT8356236.1 CoA transferase [Roseomonas mucosa]